MLEAGDALPHGTEAVRCGRIVLLNGAPSCGKTTLARSLVALLDRPWFHRSLDDFRAGYAEEFWRSDDGRLFERVMNGYLGALRAMALADNDLIAEAVITPDRRRIYAEAFADIPLTVVAVRCPLAIAQRREHERVDRPGGPIELPPDLFEAVYDIEHDYEVDTSTGTPDALATVLSRELDPFRPQ